MSSIRPPTPKKGLPSGRAFLEILVNHPSSPVLVTTTHDPHLKSLSYLDAELSRRIVSAGMAFDEETLSPTYELQLGVPGRSRALEVAKNWACLKVYWI